MFCPKCGNNLPLERAYTLTKWNYELYVCDTCKISWDLFLNRQSGLMKFSECPLYEPFQEVLHPTRS